jgi:ribonuclease HI
VSGVGYVLEGEISHSGWRYFEGEFTSMEAEHLALVEGLRIAANRSESREYCEAYSDAKPLVNKMRGSERCLDEWAERRASCQWLLDKFDSADLYYCPRGCNEDAHELARTALRRGRAENY